MVTFVSDWLEAMRLPERDRRPYFSDAYADSVLRAMEEFFKSLGSVQRKRS
jgi:hypothetical protein